MCTVPLRPPFGCTHLAQSACRHSRLCAFRINSRPALQSPVPVLPGRPSLSAGPRFWTPLLLFDSSFSCSSSVVSAVRFSFFQSPILPFYLNFSPSIVPFSFSFPSTHRPVSLPRPIRSALRPLVTAFRLSSSPSLPKRPDAWFSMFSTQ